MKHGKEFDVPSLSIEIDNLVGWINVRVKQRGDDVKRLDSETGLVERDFDLSQ